jgi:hypothetical protein
MAAGGGIAAHKACPSDFCFEHAPSRQADCEEAQAQDGDSATWGLATCTRRRAVCIHTAPRARVAVQRGWRHGGSARQDDASHLVLLVVRGARVAAEWVRGGALRIARIAHKRGGSRRLAYPPGRRSRVWAKRTVHTGTLDGPSRRLSSPPSQTWGGLATSFASFSLPAHYIHPLMPFLLSH